MSNTKISALTSATTPLAGTEVLPIVQSGATTQVSVANLTAGRTVTAARLGIGAGSFTDTLVRLGGTVGTATTLYGTYADYAIPATTTVAFYGSTTAVTTAASAFTLGTLSHYRAYQGALGASSAITTQYGFEVSSSLTGATNNYGFYGAIASSTGRYNFYAAGTAQNLFSGDVLVFGAGGLGYTTGSGGTVTQTTSRTTGVTINKTNGAITLVSAAGSTTFQSFTVTNSTVAATDVIRVVQKSGTDKYAIWVTAVAAGSFQITFATLSGTTTEQPVFNFAVIKAVTA